MKGVTEVILLKLSHRAALHPRVPALKPDHSTGAASLPDGRSSLVSQHCPRLALKSVPARLTSYKRSICQFVSMFDTSRNISQL